MEEVVRLFGAAFEQISDLSVVEMLVLGRFRIILQSDCWIRKFVGSLMGVGEN